MKGVIKMMNLFVGMRTFLGNKKGQGMVEYGLIIGLIAVGVIALLGSMGTEIKNLFQSVVDGLPG